MNITESATAEPTEFGIPNYWQKCLENTDQFDNVINEKDKKILKHLTNVTSEVKENGNFTLSFHFSQNEYFDFPVLTREHILNDNDASISKIVSTEISWKSEDLNPTVVRKQKKVKNSNFSLISININKNSIFQGFIYNLYFI